MKMATYDAYPRDQYGHVIARPTTFEATNDLLAIAQAMQWADGCDLEVWHEGQCVGAVVRTDLEPAALSQSSIRRQAPRLSC